LRWGFHLGGALGTPASTSRNTLIWWRADIIGHVTWPFDLGAVRTPVELWHGDDGAAVPVGFAKGLAVSLPEAQLHGFEGEGHFVFRSHGDEVTKSIALHAKM
jgi:pimeloyl-ACP methyl ester carboxylesterase